MLACLTQLAPWILLIAPTVAVVENVQLFSCSAVQLTVSSKNLISRPLYCKRAKRTAQSDELELNCIHVLLVLNA